MYTLLLQDNVAVKQKHEPLWMLHSDVVNRCFTSQLLLLYIVILACIESCINYSDA